MKTARFFKNAMIISSLFIGAVTISSCDKDDDDDVINNTPYTVSGNASGSQVVPSVTGTGTATITGSYNPQTRILNYTTNWNTLTGAPVSAGFYTGAAGVSGSAAGDPWTLGDGLTETGTLTGTITLTDEQAAQLISGNWYYSLGTTTNPSGEVQQIIFCILQPIRCIENA
ncbi:MAG: CHRD domain-containing protein [Bacteroidota bacterium]